jgi:ornithine cyclodeaminase
VGKLRFLDAAAIDQSLPMQEAIEGMKEAFAQLSAGMASVPLRSRIDIEKHAASTLFMPAHLIESDELAVKIVSVFPRNSEKSLPTIHAIVIAVDASTGQPTAILEGGRITAIRTGAGSGAATDMLARSDAKTVAIYGSGVQARTQLEAVCAVREIEAVWVFSIDQDGTQQFVKEMSGYGTIPADILIARDAQEPLATADIICTATTSSIPVFEGAALRPGTHINAIGSFTPEMQELDSETVRRARVFVDSKPAALTEAGDLMVPLESGEISDDWIVGELGEVINGNKPGRRSSDEITLYKSVGVAVQDAVAAGRALRRAEELGLGMVIEL